MVFLFVGSSALTEASFPRDLAVPQLLLSSAWAMLTLVMRASLTVFPHRGLSPHQFTPMSGAHKTVQRTGASDWRRYKFSVRGGWLPSLTFTLGKLMKKIRRFLFCGLAA